MNFYLSGGRGRMAKLMRSQFGHRCRSNLSKAVHERYNARESVLKRRFLRRLVALKRRRINDLRR
jgi:hypothetical protein